MNHDYARQYAVNIAELGREQGRNLPLGPNLLAVARRR